MSKQQLKISMNEQKKNKKYIFLIIILIITLYLTYKGFIYWNYNLFKEKRQIETWNSRVKKNNENKTNIVNSIIKYIPNSYIWGFRT